MPKPRNPLENVLPKPWEEASITGRRDPFNRYTGPGDTNDGMGDPRIQPVYDRGTGWTDSQWRRFDGWQQQEADGQEGWANSLDATAGRMEAGEPQTEADREVLRRFARIFGITAPTADQLRQLSGYLKNNVTALRGKADEGWVANAMSLKELRTYGRENTKDWNPGPDVFMAVPRGSRELFVNKSHDLFMDEEMTRDGINHEPNHGEGNGLKDQVYGGQTVYRFGTDGQRRAYGDLRRRNPVQTLLSPDHIAEFVEDRPPR